MKNSAPHPAEYWHRESGAIRCELCPHACLIPRGKVGFCLARRNVEGQLIAESYGKVTSIAVDPIQKKPLNRYYPENTILTAASYGCNFKCPFCQNHHISQQEADFTFYAPETLRDMALHYTAFDNIGLAFSYNEPTINFEYIRDSYRLVKEAGLKNILVTNGYLSEEPWQELLTLVDAMNIDLKAFSDTFYRGQCKGDLETVKRNILAAVKKCHIELTTLVIPGCNDSIEEITAMAQWIAAIDPEIPYHISRFHPRYEMSDLAPTPVDTLDDAAEAASQYLHYIYLGNL
ncbi:MAG: AmmeMemoRadiSam system radical SAM enzyme [Bacillota bacterium]|nr:AmmeMemoRadiSam system radical SAM enzyme [Bacillota bacterium]